MCNQLFIMQMWNMFLSLSPLYIVMHRYLTFFQKIFFPHATRKVYVWLLVSFIISLDKTTCLKRIIKQSHSTACLLAALLLASLKACGSVLKAISHGNTLLVSNDLIPPLLHTLRIVFYKKLRPSHLYRILKSTFTRNFIML